MTHALRSPRPWNSHTATLQRMLSAIVPNNACNSALIGSRLPYQSGPGFPGSCHSCASQRFL